MTMDDGGNILVAFFVGILLGLIVAGACSNNLVRSHRAEIEAVAHGAGQWVTDKDGNVEFRWYEAPDSVRKP